MTRRSRPAATDDKVIAVLRSNHARQMDFGQASGVVKSLLG